MARINEESSNVVTVSVGLVPNIVVYNAKYSDIKKIRKAQADIIGILSKVKSQVEDN